MRISSLLLKVAVAACLSLLLFTGSAWAHAQLLDSSPQRGASLDESPSEVTFTFSEPVESSLGGVSVFDTEGNQVQSGKLATESADTIGAELPPGLADGLYTATYQVVSADSHPINGGITFTVGDSSAGGAAFVADQTISDLLADSDAGPVTQVGFWFDRWLGFLAIAFAIGLTVWLLWIWGNRTKDAQRSVETRTRRLLLAAVAVGFLATLLAIPFQAAIATGQSLWESFGTGIVGDVVDTRFGEMMVVRLAAWILIVPFALSPFRGSGGFAIKSGFAALGLLGLVITPGLAGHASTQDPAWLMIPGNALHVATMGVWAGGLLAMFTVLPLGTSSIEVGRERTSLLLDVTRRFSTVALISVVLVAVSGLIQAIVEVGSFGELVNSAFGRSVSLKLILFAVLVVLGWMNRARIIPALAGRLDKDSSPGKPGVRLRSNLRLEVLLIVATLGVTAALVSYPPPASTSAGPVAGSTMVGQDRVDFTVDPARLGANEMHIYLFDGKTGAPVEVQGMKGTLSQEEAGVAPIDLDLQKAGPGHYTTPAAMIGVKGEWTADIAIRLSRFEEPSAEFKFEVE